MIIGALTAHWSILRAVADQSIEGHPYADVLKRLDGDMGRLYRRMCLALGEANVPIETWSPPMVHLGRLAEIVLLDKPQAPAVISVPFGAAYDAAQQLPIAHELGHIAGRRVAGLLDQLKAPARQAIRSSRLSGYCEALERWLVPWLEEIVADLFGTALANRPFVEEAINLMTLPHSLIGVTDGEHPVALIRPYVHLTLLHHLAERAAPGFEEAYTAIQPRLEQLTGALLRRRFESSDPLVPLTLGDLRDATVAVVQQILGARLDALGGATLATVLARCVDTGEAEIETAPQPWGAIADNECMSFVLRRPDALEAGWPEEILRLVREGIDQLRSAAETGE